VCRQPAAMGCGASKDSAVTGVNLTQPGGGGKATAGPAHSGNRVQPGGDPHNEAADGGGAGADADLVSAIETSLTIAADMGIAMNCRPVSITPDQRKLAQRGYDLQFSHPLTTHPVESVPALEPKETKAGGGRLPDNVKRHTPRCWAQMLKDSPSATASKVAGEEPAAADAAAEPAADAAAEPAADVAAEPAADVAAEPAADAQ
jgi:hypothetical protein